VKLEITELVSEVSEFNMETYSSTNSAVRSNDETHDGITEDTGTDCHFPAQTSCDHGRS
jgi:hypothetical protein